MDTGWALDTYFGGRRASVERGHSWRLGCMVYGGHELWFQDVELSAESV